MDKQFCQSCGMPLSDVNKGTNADGSLWINNFVKVAVCLFRM